MADPEVRILTGDDDIEMQGDENDGDVEVAETGARNGEEGEKEDEIVGISTPRMTFIESVVASDSSNLTIATPIDSS